jgi:hypothetical protein
MGSDRRHLSGKALAKIFEEISTGPSFVPLRRPRPVIVTPPVWTFRLVVCASTNKVQQIPRPSREEVDRENGSDASPRPTPDQGESRTHSTGKTPSDKITMKEPTSSSSRPPPPHPILKKSRGPSVSSGKRPTARFVSPHESEDEAVKDSETSSESMGGTGLAMRPRPAASSAKGEKKSTPTGRKHIASTSASRRRPGLPRRQSSQSSAISDASTKVSTGSRSSVGSRAGSVEQTATALHASSGASTLVNSPVVSSKAAGKRPFRGTPPDTDRSSIRNDSPATEKLGRPVIVQPQASSLGAAPSRPKNSPTPSYESSRLRFEISRDPSTRSLLAGSLTTNPTQHHPGAAMMVRSQSDIGTTQHRSREVGMSRPPPHNLLAPTEATPSHVMVSKDVAQVRFDSASVTPVGAGSEPRDIPDSVTLPSRASSTSLFSPTQASTSPGIHLGRSKSQLTLLLERDKDRHGDNQAKTRPIREKKEK